MYTSREVSNYILEMYENENATITVRRLHALLFLMQRYFCDFHNRRFISDSIEATVFGPVVWSIAEDNAIGSFALAYDTYSNEKSLLKKDQKIVSRFIVSCWELYRYMDDFELIEKTKNDAAFKKALSNKNDKEIYYRYFYEEIKPYD